MRSKTVTHAMILAGILATAEVHAAPTQWTAGSGANGHYYDVIGSGTATIRWDDANTAAQASSFMGMQGHLVSITSAEENAFVFGLVNDSQYFQVDSAGNSQGPWLGARQVTPSDPFTWVTGEAFVFNSFAPGEPNNFGGNEDYLQFFCNNGAICGNWNDVPVNSINVHHYIVEYEARAVETPEPATLALMALGLFGLAGARRRA